MSAFAAQFAREFLAVFREASPFILLGFAIAACLHVLLPVSQVQRLLGAGKARSILIASLLGVPLPLCSCSVVPTALSLRRHGAGRGATVSFLISTPETGVDSIALTWGLMDPLMALFRPFAALVTAITAGFATEALGDDEPRFAEPPADAARDHAPEHEHAAEHGHAALPAPSGGTLQRLRAGFRGAFVELFDETSHWMLAGLVISALISALLPAELVTRWLSKGPVPMVFMLLVGIPMYICASASTPIAAALVAKGLSPGAALVFLLAGPATNVGTLAILSRALGRRATTVYLASISVLALAFGLLLDAVYPALKMDPRAALGQARNLPGWLTWPCMAVFALLLFLSFRRVAPPDEFRAVGRFLGRIGIRPSRRFALGVAAVLLAGWVLSGFFVIVPPGNRALLRRFGEPLVPLRGEGVHLKWPPPVDRVTLFAADEVRRIELGFRSAGTTTAPPDTTTGNETRALEEEAVYLTGDENLLNTKAVVQYQITDPERWVYGFRDPENVLKLSTLAAAVDVLAGYGIDDVYAGDRSVVEGQVLLRLRARADSLQLGARVLRYCIVDVHAPAEVHAAFRDVASAQEDKQTAINVAYRYLDETVNLAHGEAARQVEVARSDSETSVLRAQGESQSLKDRSAAYRQRRVGTKKRLYLETIEEILAKARKIVRPGWKGSGGVDLWLGNGAAAPKPVADVIRGGAVRQKQAQEDATPNANPPAGEEP